MSAKKPFALIAAMLALVFAAAAPAQAAQTSCGQSCANASVAADHDRGTRGAPTLVAWSSGGVGTQRSGR